MARLFQAVQLLLKSSVPKDVALHVDGGDGDLSVEANYTELQQCLLNLSLNALQAMPDGGVLTLSAQPEGDVQLRLSVADTGMGMDADTLSRLFSPFFTTKPDGTGLGLISCKRIVESYGGTIQVTSHKGEGTRFDIVLPLRAASSTVGDNEPELPLGRGQRILLVDGEATRLSLLGNALSSQGYQPQLAADGAAALQYAQQHALPDLVIVDSDIILLSAVSLLLTMQELGYQGPAIVLEDVGNRCSASISRRISRSIAAQAAGDAAGVPRRGARAGNRLDPRQLPRKARQVWTASVNLRDQLAWMSAYKGVSASRRMRSVTRRSSRRIRARSMGMPTDRFERMVESSDTSAVRAASSRCGLGPDDAVQDRLAVLGLADLQVRRLGRGSDRVAERIDHVQARALASDLAAQHQRGLGADALELRPIGSVHLAADQHLADVLGHFEQMAEAAQIERGIIFDIALQPGQRQLGGGQVAGGHQREHRLARIFEQVQLAIHAHIVQRSVGAGIGGEYQAFVHFDADAIGHGAAIGAGTAILGSRWHRFVKRWLTLLPRACANIA